MTNMSPLVGWALGGAVVRPDGRGRLGEPSWSPNQLLRDLELRLGLPALTRTAAQRVPSYVRRLAAHPDAFYSRSLEADALGTATKLLEWRDALVLAGWNGEAVPNGGDRLGALAAAGIDDDDIDRAVRVESELRSSSKHAIYDLVTLVEPRELWPARWQFIFTLLEERGARFAEHATADAGAPLAPEGTDLGTLQRMITGAIPSCGPKDPPAARGDGTVLLLRGETAGDLAELTAALLRETKERAVVVRGRDNAPLEAALSRHGLSPQGHASASEWRPAMQILPLALELAYAPRDPYRVLELLTLPVGPFRGSFGRRLARAVARQPGVGGAEWNRQQADAIARARTNHGDAYAGDRLARAAAWIEAEGSPEAGAPKGALLAVATRVREFLQKRLREPEIYAAAHDQAGDLVDALVRDERPALSREDMRHLLDRVVRGAQSLDVTIERAGRLDHVDHPGALLATTGAVVFWGFVAGTERRAARPPWNRAELAALGAAGVSFPDPAALLGVESRAWRQAILAAGARVVFVVPGAAKGSPRAPHPMWDEIAARLGLTSEAALARVTRTPHDLLARREALVPTTDIDALPLPASRATWTLPRDRAHPEAALQTSATALSALASCPLRFVLAEHAKIRGGALAKVASGPLLNGTLGHRLVEELFRKGAFDLDDDAFTTEARATLDSLLETEGATLLLSGAAFERMQLVPQLVRAMRRLRDYLVETGWRIAAVEEAVTTTSTIGTLKGRLDVRLRNAAGKQAVLDLKWGDSKYGSLLEEGRAVQLAAYVHGVRELGYKTSIPPAAYFSLSNARVLAADERMGLPENKTLGGATLAETWSRVERTAKAVQGALRSGVVNVAATKNALPLLDALAIPKDQHASYYALAAPGDACDDCHYSALCGKAWESVR